jgi:hypothetical protein
MAGFVVGKFSSVRHELGEYIVNEEPIERGQPGRRYMVVGWVFTKDGWEEVRCLTGN